MEAMIVRLLLKTVALFGSGKRRCTLISLLVALLAIETHKKSSIRSSEVGLNNNAVSV